MIEVVAPDGTVVEFPAGTPAATIRQVMQSRFPPTAQPQAGAQRNPDGTYGQIPEGFVLNPQTGQYTTREMMAGNMQPSRAGAALAGAAHGFTAGGVDEIAGGLGAGAGQRDFQIERARARYDAAQRDFPGTTLAGEVAGAVALPGAARTVKGAIGLGAGFGTLYGGLSAEGDVGDRALPAGVGAVIGGAAGAAAVPIGRAVAWAGQTFGGAVANVFRSNKLYQNGQLTQAGRETLEALGYSADEVSDAFTRHFAREATKSVQPQTAASVASMREFGIPAYRHNVTGLADDFATFERARRGAVGPRAETIVRGAADEQFNAVRAAGERIATDMGGETVDQFGAATMAQQGVRAARDTARKTAGEAYEALEAAGGGVRGSAVQGIGGKVRNSLRMSGVTLDPNLTPNAISAIRDLDAAFKTAGKGSVQFMDIERARQNLVRLRSAAAKGSLGADQRAMGELVQAFDDQVDNLMTTALVQGDDAVLKAAQKARGLWAQYRQTFQGDGAASRFIQKMADEDASPDDVARWLFSSGKLGSGQFNSTLAKGLRDVLGETSTEWNSIRQAAFRQMTQRPEGITDWGPAAMANRIQEFLGSHTSRDLSQTLFSKQEIATMQRYSTALRRMVPPPGAVSYSGTAYENARMARATANSRVLRQTFQALSGMLGAGAGAIASSGSMMAAAGAGVGFLAAAAAGAARSALAVRGMLSSTAPRAAPNVARAVTGAAAGGVSAAGEPVTNALRPSLRQ